jgi:hypothetical protein
MTINTKEFIQWQQDHLSDHLEDLYDRKSAVSRSITNIQFPVDGTPLQRAFAELSSRHRQPVTVSAAAINQPARQPGKSLFSFFRPAAAPANDNANVKDNTSKDVPGNKNR